jgi:hypothetical protein
MQTKAAESSAIFADLKSLRSNFGAPSSGLRRGARELMPLSQSDIDVNDPSCTKTADTTLSSGKIQRTWVCNQLSDAGFQICTVIAEFSGETEVSRNVSCNSGGSSGDSQDDSSPSETAQAWIPTTQSMESCAGAFDTFESMFAQGQTEVENLATWLKDPSSAEGNNGGEWKATSPSGSEAVAWILAPQQAIDGLSVSGRIGGGGTDTLITMNQTIDMTIDMDKLMGAIGGGGIPGIPGAQLDVPGSSTSGSRLPLQELGVTTHKGSMTAEVDLDARTINYNIDMAMGQKTTTTEDTSTMKGTLIVSAGSEKSVKQDFAVASRSTATTPPTVTASTVSMSARLLDEQNLRIEGSINSEGQAPTTVGVTITKGTDGQCTTKIDSTL